MPEDKTLPAYTLRTNLTTVLDEVTGGATYTLTRYGRPIATLGPFQMDVPDASGPTHRKPAVTLDVRNASTSSSATGAIDRRPGQLSPEEIEAYNQRSLKIKR